MTKFDKSVKEFKATKHLKKIKNDVLSF